jgi:ABC-type Mn2+/Zn2+ transport system permease subunit
MNSIFKKVKWDDQEQALFGNITRYTILIIIIIIIIIIMCLIFYFMMIEKIFEFFFDRWFNHVQHAPTLKVSDIVALIQTPPPAVRINNNIGLFMY